MTTPSFKTAPRSGDILGDFRLGDKIGAGGMGEVFRAQNVHAARMLRAIKVIRSELAASADFRARFLREAELLDALDHPNILRVHHIGEEDGVLFMVMELLQGCSLDRLDLLPGTLTVGAAANLIHQGLSGVGHAHEQGIIHRDLKLANLFLTPGGVKVLDFGIARHEGSAQARLTQTGQGLPGSPAYYAPEFADGQPASPASDVYAMGICLFELLSGQLPFQAGGGNDAQATMSLLMQHASRPLPDVRALRPDIPDGLVEVLERAAAKKPAERFANAVQFGAALLPFISQDLGALLSRLRRSQDAMSPLSAPRQATEVDSESTTGSQTRFPLSGSQTPASSASATRFALPGPATPTAHGPGAGEKRNARRKGWYALGIVGGGLLIGGIWLATKPPFSQAPPKQTSPVQPQQTSQAAPQQTSQAAPPTGVGALAPPASPPPAASGDKPAVALEPPPAGMVTLSGGTLHQGRADYGDVSARDVPVDDVVVKSFAIEITEVSIESYRDFVLATGSRQPWPAGVALSAASAARPVANVSFLEAEAYCRWRYAGEGRLPTESEWEWAARGKAGWLFPWGNEFKKKCANVLLGPNGPLRPVAEHGCDRTPNGIIGLSGNVREWTASLPGLYRGSSARLTGGKDQRVVRGGSVASAEPNEVTLTARSFVAEPARDLGFRCAYTPKALPSQPADPLPAGLVAIAGGLLRQGRRPDGNPDAPDTPIQNVRVAPFAIERTEVTVDAYQEFVEAEKRSAPWDKAALATLHKRPASGIAHAEAAAYCAWRYPSGHLPTEPQWEWVARGAQGRNYPFGDLFKQELASSSVGKKGVLEPVRSHPKGATPEGVMDLAGSVWEWTSSKASAYPGSTFQVPVDPESFVIRAGAYDSKSPVDLTGMARQFASRPGPTIGFRCVVDR